MHKRIAVALALALVALAPLAEARAKKPALEPGKYKEWGEDIDEIEIAKSFKTSDYDNIAVTRIDTSKTPLPDPKEKWYESAKTVLNGYTEMGQGLLTVLVQFAVEVSGLHASIFRPKVDSTYALGCGQTTGSRATCSSSCTTRLPRVSQCAT